MRAYMVTLFSVYTGDLQGFLGDLGIDIGGLRIGLIVDLLLACRSACYLAR